MQNYLLFYAHFYLSNTPSKRWNIKDKELLFQTFDLVASKELAVVHGDERVAEEGAEEIEEGNDAVGVLEGHGRPPRDQLEQRHHGAEWSRERRRVSNSGSSSFHIL